MCYYLIMFTEYHLHLTGDINVYRKYDNINLLQNDKSINLKNILGTGGFITKVTVEIIDI